MSDWTYVSIYTESALSGISIRYGETKVGQRIRLLPSTDNLRFQHSLDVSVKCGARYAVIGIPEDIGPQANLGRTGADRAWESFLQFFLNMQANRFIDPSTIVLVGEVDLSDIKEELDIRAKKNGSASVTELRDLCAKIDRRVYPVILQIVMAGLEPIIVAGGNNNSYPAIKAVVKGMRDRLNDPNLALSTVNCDPHADFRIIEGRHSGNPFTYADRDGLLKAYCVLGAHENYNSEDMLQRMAKKNYPLFFWDQIVRGEETWEQQVQRAVNYLSEHRSIKGLELDLDSIKNLPCSAKTPFGISEEQAFYFIHKVASTLDTKYLHLSEAAPTHGEDGMRTVGKVLAKSVVEYVRARERYRTAQLRPAHAQATAFAAGHFVAAYEF